MSMRCCVSRATSRMASGLRSSVTAYLVLASQPYITLVSQSSVPFPARLSTTLRNLTQYRMISIMGWTQVRNVSNTHQNNQCNQSTVHYYYYVPNIYIIHEPSKCCVEITIFLLYLLLQRDIYHSHSVVQTILSLNQFFLLQELWSRYQYYLISAPASFVFFISAPTPAFYWLQCIFKLKSIFYLKPFAFGRNSSWQS